MVAKYVWDEWVNFGAMAWKLLSDEVKKSKVKIGAEKWCWRHQK